MSRTGLSRLAELVPMMAVSLGDRDLRDEVRDQACLDFEGAQGSCKTGQEGFTGPQPLCLLPILSRKQWNCYQYLFCQCNLEA